MHFSQEAGDGRAGEDDGDAAEVQEFIWIMGGVSCIARLQLGKL